jgi:hypothetical protein|eukprot:SAG25_NODE_1156_length_3756_cov_3.235986_2_plen_189_part_00
MLYFGALFELAATFEKRTLTPLPRRPQDTVDGDQRSTVAGNVSMLKVGVGFFCGAAFISKFSADNPRPGYFACAAATAAATAVLSPIVETLPSSKRKPILWQKTQPLSFLALLHPYSAYNRTSGGAVWRLAIAASLQKGTNKGVEQALNVMTRERFAWGAAHMSRYHLRVIMITSRTPDRLRFPYALR